MKKREKKILAVLAALLCIGAAGTGSTLAFFTDSESFTNELYFAGEDGLDAVLEEPSWEEEKGLLVLPGETIPKDPQITNTSELDMDCLAAIRVEFVYGKDCPDRAKIGQALSDADMAYVHDVYRIDWNADISGDWARFDGESEGNQTQRFYYKAVLKRNLPEKGDTTVPLFTRLEIPKEVNNRRYSHIQDMGGFDIRISGTVIQQMNGESIHGLDSAKDAYRAGLFTFSGK